MGAIGGVLKAGSLTFLDQRRFNNIAIALTRLGLPSAAIRDAVLSSDETVLTPDVVELLVQVITSYLRAGCWLPADCLLPPGCLLMPVTECHPNAIRMPSECHPNAIRLPSDCHLIAMPMPPDCRLVPCLVDHVVELCSCSAHRPPTTWRRSRRTMAIQSCSRRSSASSGTCTRCFPSELPSARHQIATPGLPADGH